MLNTERGRLIHPKILVNDLPKISESIGDKFKAKYGNMTSSEFDKIVKEANMKKKAKIL